MKLLKYKSSKKFVKNFLLKSNTEFMILRVFDVIGFNDNLKKFSLDLIKENLKFVVNKYKTQQFRRFFSPKFSFIFVGKFLFIFFYELSFLKHFFKFFKDKKMLFHIFFIFYKNRFFLAKYFESFLLKSDLFNSKKICFFFFEYFFKLFVKFYKLFFFQIQKLNFFIKNGNN